MTASVNGHGGVVDTLIAAGADVNHQNKVSVGDGSVYATPLPLSSLSVF